MTLLTQQVVDIRKIDEAGAHPIKATKFSMIIWQRKVEK
jgi:hypothetical protein